MIYYMLKNNRGYLKQIDKKEGVEIVDTFILAYKFSCEKSALAFKEKYKLDDFTVVECRCL